MFVAERAACAQVTSRFPTRRPEGAAGNDGLVHLCIPEQVELLMRRLL